MDLDLAAALPKDCSVLIPFYGYCMVLFSMNVFPIFVLIVVFLTHTMGDCPLIFEEVSAAPKGSTPLWSFYACHGK